MMTKWSTRTIVTATLALGLCLTALANARSGGSPAEALVGQAAPAFTLNTPSGESVSLESLKGSVVVLDFWATWCGPCVAALPKVDKLAKEHSDVKFFAVNIREPVEKVSKFMADKNLSLPVLMDSTAQAAKDYKAQAIPQTVVIGKDGVVKAVFVGFNPETGEKALADAIVAAKGG